MDTFAVNKLRKVVYVAVEFTTGLTDLVVAIRKPDGSALAPAPAVTEQGDGIYTFEYTPDVVGVWQEKVSSVVNGDRAIRSVKVTAADIDDVKTKADTIETKVDAVQTSVNTVETKVDAVDTKVTAVDGKVDAVKAKTDNLPADTETTLQNIQTAVDGISTEIKPGGYFA